ncbi:hypothetical protein [Rheinheimera fenheensis]|uniref:hypothetical protein n=1 Tax=Rheinheimera fenheensis TaxID=3152295 RepID=UPI00325FE021
MKIILSPIITSNEADTPPSVSGNVLIYRGQQYDLSQLPDGGEVEADEPFIGLVKRVNGQVKLVLAYRYNTNTAEPYQSTDWADYTFVVESGQCPDPIRYKPMQQEPENVD